MIRPSQLAVAAGLSVIAVTAVGVARLQALQRIGTPGVKLIDQAVFMEDGTQIGAQTVPLPTVVLDYQSHEEPIGKKVVNWLPKDTTYAQRIYEAPDHFRIQANVVLMGTDRTSIHKPEYCLPAQGFQTDKAEFDRIHMTEPRPYDLAVRKFTVHRDAKTPEGQLIHQSALYVFWFVADNQLTADHSERMWWMARDLLTKGVLQRWAYISCFSVCRPGEEDEAYRRMQTWIKAAVPQFQRAAGAALAITSNP